MRLCRKDAVWGLILKLSVKWVVGNSTFVPHFFLEFCFTPWPAHQFLCLLWIDDEEEKHALSLINWKEQGTLLTLASAFEQEVTRLSQETEPRLKLKANLETTSKAQGMHLLLTRFGFYRGCCLFPATSFPSTWAEGDRVSCTLQHPLLTSFAFYLSSWRSELRNWASTSNMNTHWHESVTISSGGPQEGVRVQQLQLQIRTLR